MLAVVVKHPTQRFNVNTIAYALAHPAMQRRLSFRHKEVRRVAWANGSYGVSEPLPAELASDFDLDFGPQRQRNKHHWYTPQSALAEVLRQAADKQITV